MRRIEKIIAWMRIFATLLLCIFSVVQIWTQTTSTHQEVAPVREMRGLWVAVVGNIDWPSSAGLSVGTLKREATTILDRAKSMGLNTIFLQVRPSADAIYQSSLEPLSYYLVGSDVAKNDLSFEFDALSFWVSEAHKRGLELHAWINPFRVTPMAEFMCAQNHLSKTHPEWTITYAGKMYLDPGIPEARDYVVGIVDDIVSRYDIDGVHFDDYFYPYPVSGEMFHDEKSYKKYNVQSLALDDWRRSNVDSVISKVSRVVDAKPWVKFGVSPFGVWRNKSDDPRGSDTRAGLTDYDVLYADIMSWVKSGWIDYIVPQVYWEAGNNAADFDKVSSWWAEACSQSDVQVYVGHAVHKVNSSKPWKNANEMPSQIKKVRDDSRLSGSVFFSYRQFNRDILGLEEALRTDLYSMPSLSPVISRNADSMSVSVDDISYSGNVLSWTVSSPSDVRFYVIYRYPRGKRNEEEIVDIVGADGKCVQYELTNNAYSYSSVHSSEKGAESSGRRKYIFRVAPVDVYGYEHAKSSRCRVRY